MSDVQTTVLELPDTLRDPMRNKVNHGLMVEWINRDLQNRASHSVRTSIALYDADGLFEHALPASLADLPNFSEILQALFDGTNFRFYSKGL